MPLPKGKPSQSSTQIQLKSSASERFLLHVTIIFLQKWRWKNNQKAVLGARPKVEQQRPSPSSHQICVPSEPLGVAISVSYHHDMLLQLNKQTLAGKDVFPCTFLPVQRTVTQSPSSTSRFRSPFYFQNTGPRISLLHISCAPSFVGSSGKSSTIGNQCFPLSSGIKLLC